MSEGILTDYLDRRSREVINMLCAKYDYKADIAMKKKEAFEDGMEAGLNKKAEETALALLEKDFSPEIIAECVKLPLEKVLELQESIKVKA